MNDELGVSRISTCQQRGIVYRSKRGNVKKRFKQLITEIYAL